MLTLMSVLTALMTVMLVVGYVKTSRDILFVTGANPDGPEMVRTAQTSTNARPILIHVGKALLVKI